jgi:putative tricarboxylic transport membrane protein
MDRICGAILLLLGLGILWEGRGISFGRLSAPGPGFFPTILAILLILVSFLLIVPGKKKESDSFGGWSKVFKRVLPVFAILMVYFFLLECLGFVISGLLLMMVLFIKVGSQRWYVALLGACASIGSAYVLFGVLLKSSLPRGVLGF